MAFCKYCGTQLQEGENCTCEKAVAARTPAPEAAPAPEATPAPETTPVQEAIPVAQPQAPSQAQIQAKEILDKSKTVALGILGKLMAIWKKPTEEGVALINTGSTVDAMIFMAIQAVLSGLLGIAQLGKLEAAYNKVMESYNAALGMFGGEAAKLELPYFQVFILLIVVSLGISALFFGLFFIAMPILKSEAKSGQLLRYTSLVSVAAIPFTLVAFVFTFFNQGLGLAVNALAVIFSYTYLMQGAKAIDDISENKRAYLVAIVSTIVVILTVLIVSSVLGEAVKELVSEFSSLFSLFG